MQNTEGKLIKTSQMLNSSAKYGICKNAVYTIKTASSRILHHKKP